MNPLLLGGIFDIGKRLIDRLIPDPTEKAKAELELFAMHQAGELKELEVSMSAIVMEAKSADPWTSRARPSFLYVMYAMILFSIPMGFLFAFKPEVAADVTTGVKDWLEAIPAEMWALFGTGYLGYVTNRSQDKARMMGQEIKPGLLSKMMG